MRGSSACGSAPTAKTDHASRRRSPAGSRRRSASVARRRSARVSRGPVTTIDGRYRAPEGAPHVLSEHTGSLAVSRNRRRVMTSECPRRLAAEARACSRPPRHPVQTPARRGHGGVASRRVDVVVCPASTIPRCQRPFGVRRQDVRGTLFSSVPSVDRGDRPTGHPGRAAASYSCRAAATASGRAAARSVISLRGWRAAAGA